MKSHSFLAACALFGLVPAAPLDLVLPGGIGHGGSRIPRQGGGVSLPTSKGPSGVIIGPNLARTRQVKYSENWAGAVQISSNITEISASFTVPRVTVPAGMSNSTQYGGSAWIGIDGYTCTNAIFQTGVDWTIQDGEPRYHAWYEWYPEYTHNFNMTVNAGDRMDILAIVHNTTGGTGYVTNRSTNVTVTHTFAGQEPLCQGNAEWIVEDYLASTPTGSSLIPFARFSDVVFHNASYCTDRGQHGVENSTILDMRTSAGKVMATCDTEGGDMVKCTYKS